MKFEIDKVLLDSLFKYFSARPYAEAVGFINALSQLKTLEAPKVQEVALEQK